MMDPELEVVSKFNPILSHSQIVNMIIGVNSWSCEVCMNHLEAKKILKKKKKKVF
jgi:hypothetical protein